MNSKTNFVRFLSRLSYANVTATVAVFLAMGGGAVAATHLGRGTVGTAQLKAGAVTGAKVKDGSLTGADVDAATLGKVPAATRADSATSADHATAAGRADTAARADSATIAGNTRTADTALATESLLPTEPVHYFGEPGEPRLEGAFQVLTPIGFYRDHQGVVHLEGQIEPLQGAGQTLTANLPAAYRPASLQLFAAVSQTRSQIRAYPDGRLELPVPSANSPISFDGITWRAGS